MSRITVISLAAAASLCLLAPEARAHHDHPRYVTPPKVVHHHSHWHRFDRRYLRLSVREQRRQEAAWARHLRKHDRYWGRDCRYRDRYHDHVRIGGRVVIRIGS